MSSEVTAAASAATPKDAHLSTLADVDIDPSGIFKYILIKVRFYAN